MIPREDLYPVCARYTAQNYYVGSTIPDRKFSNACKLYSIPSHDFIIALIDTTVFGSAKTGLAIGEHRAYWRNLNTQTERNDLSWDEFASMPMKAKGILYPRIEVGEGITIELTGAFDKNDVLQLLSEIQHLARNPSSARSQAVRENNQWMLAVDGEQYGPYDVSTIKSMLDGDRLDPDSSYAWREGMPNWVEFNRVRELKDLTEEPNPESMPPPLPRAPSRVGSETMERSPQRSFRTEDRREHSIRVDLNNDSEEKLLALPGITLSSSLRLVRERGKRGGFNTFEEVGHFLDLQPHQVQRLKERAHIGSYRGTRPKSGGRVVDF